MSRRYRGVVLAAGLGTRLRPLTTYYPKPLIPFLGTTALTLALWRLQLAGITDIAVNAHYLPEMIASALQRNPLALQLHLSLEPEILGTGGAYNPLRAWREDAHLVVVNGDIISSVDIASSLAVHERTGAVATMVLLPAVIPGEAGVYHASERVLAIGRTGPVGTVVGNYACVQILSPAFLALLPASGFFDIISQGYQPALQAGLRISTVVHEGIWHDLRNPHFYAAAVRDTLASLVTQGDPAGVAACRAAEGLETHITGDGHVIYDHTCHIGPDAELRGVILEPRVRIGAGSRLDDCIVLPDTVLAAGTVASRQILGPQLAIDLG